MMENQKGFANIALIILAVIIVGAAGYFVLTNKVSAPATPQDQEVIPTLTVAQPPPTPTSRIDTSTWKTYRNEKLGYQIQFPNDSVLAIEDANLGAAGHQIVKDFPSNASFVSIKNGSVFLSICEDCGGYGVGTNNTKIEEVVNLDSKIYKASGFLSNDKLYTHKILFIDIQNFKIIYGISSEYGQPLDQREIDRSYKLIAQILSTFKFI